MMKQKSALIIITMLVIACLGGCGKQAAQNPSSNASMSLDSNQQLEEADIEKGQDDSSGTDPADGDQLFAECTLTGTVTEFSDDGCKITPTFQNGAIAYEAAPGYEDESDMVNIIYDKECSFRIANVNIVTGNVVYDAATTEDVKKQTHILIYGVYDSENNLIADHIYIYRSTEG